MLVLRASLAFSLFSVAAFVACGGHPGGTVGAPCYDLGDNDPDCYADEICDTIQGGDRYCLRRCDDQGDCDAYEDCNGTKKGKDKACHPKLDCNPDDPGC
jgi:hypothetical protein